MPHLQAAVCVSGANMAHQVHSLLGDDTCTSRVCGMHPRVANLLRAAAKGKEEASVIPAVAQRVGSRLEALVGPGKWAVWVGPVMGKPYAILPDDSDLHGCAVVVALMVDIIDIDSKQATIVAHSVDGDLSKRIFDSLYKADFSA